MRSDKPRILVSRCIEFDHCRYDGHILSSPIVHKLKEHVEFITVCPEVEIGLGVPREAIRLVREGENVKLIKSMSGDDHTKAMEMFADDFIRKLPEIHGCILKSRSPSCGIKDVKIYPSAGRIASLPGSETGLFGKKILHTLVGIPVEDEGRLTNLRLREHFLTSVYLLWDFDNLETSMKNLVSFHTRNKYLFMAYNQVKLKEAGKIVANHERLNVKDVFTSYRNKLVEIISKIPRYTSNINVLMHVFGYFRQNLSKDEKDYYFSNLELYRSRQLPLIALITIIRAWIERFDDKYLREQTFLQPYPVELISSYDSDRGKMYY
ncbi:MAG: DUF1722 domain-containing protein [Candidatus Cloacimonetes bacterium]|nr:DUF1722 domain-containing protein [Candidatus Cloacimonadota bacterium]